MVLPVVDLRRLLGLPCAPLDEAARVIVIARGAAVGYVVDRIDGLVALPAAGLRKTTPARDRSTRIFWTVSSRAPKAKAPSRF